MLAFAFPSLLDCLRGPWHQARAQFVKQSDFFRDLCIPARYVCFPCWTALPETVLEKRPPLSRGPTRS